MIPTAPWTISTLMYEKCPASGGNKKSAFNLENQSSLILFVYNFLEADTLNKTSAVHTI